MSLKTLPELSQGPQWRARWLKSNMVASFEKFRLAEASSVRIDNQRLDFPEATV
jgi:hypothetical protein